MLEEVYVPGVLVDTADLSRDEWLDYRRKGVGGSDAAAVLGVSPFLTARDLYYDKLNIATPEDEDSNWVQKEIGHLLEDLVAEIFHRKTGFPVYQVKKMFYHPEHPYMLADVDYFVTLSDGRTAILEIKTTNYNAKDKWWRDGEETVPVNYEIQGRHYMCVMNIDTVYFCCLYGNNDEEVIIRRIDRDKSYEDELIALEGDFWNEYVSKKIPPPYTEDGQIVLDSLNRIVGADTDAPAVELENTTVNYVKRYLELQEQKRQADALSKELESEMKWMQGQIVAAMGKSCTAACNVGDTAYTITYNPSRKTGINKDNLLRMHEEYPELYDTYVTVTESRRFYVKKSPKKAA